MEIKHCARCGKELSILEQATGHTKHCFDCAEIRKGATRGAFGRYHYRGFLLCKKYLPNYQFYGWVASEPATLYVKYNAKTKKELMKLIDEDIAKKKGDKIDQIEGGLK